MINITLADGSQKQFPGAVTAQAVAEAIGPGLAKAALAAEVDQQLVDLILSIEKDAQLKNYYCKDPASLEVIRHSRPFVSASGENFISTSASDYRSRD